MAEAPVTMRERLEYTGITVALGLLRRLPYRARVRLAGRAMVALSGPLGLRARVRENLAHVLPDLPAAEVRALERAVPDTIGRLFIEEFSPDGLDTMARAAWFGGPGVAALEEARAAGRPIIIASGHIGNYDAYRRALLQRGFNVGSLYRPFNNRPFDRRYRAVMEDGGGVLFARGRAGMAGMVRHLRAGGVLGVLHDQHMDRGADLRFFGKPAMTATSAADLALKYDALLVPVYGIRRLDGLHFDLVTEAPIPHGDPLAMTQALNDSLEAQVRAHMGQWIWTHRRWKVPRRRQAQAGAI